MAPSVTRANKKWHLTYLPSVESKRCASLTPAFCSCSRFATSRRHDVLLSLANPIRAKVAPWSSLGIQAFWRNQASRTVRAVPLTLSVSRFRLSILLAARRRDLRREGPPQPRDRRAAHPGRPRAQARAHGLVLAGRRPGDRHPGDPVQAVGQGAATPAGEWETAVCCECRRLKQQTEERASRRC
jgi:hypothetical protein